MGNALEIVGAQNQRTFTGEEIALIKSSIAVNATDDELKLFINVCQRTGLDPFSRQIYFMKRTSWNPTTRQNEGRMSAEASIDGLRLCAERSGQYAGQQEPMWCGGDGIWKDIWLDRENPPAAAKVGVMRHDFKEPTVGKALYSEYVQMVGKDNEKRPNSMWSKMAANQLAKCAEALALRKAFPRELSGVYTRDEMGQADSPAEVEVMSPATQLTKAEAREAQQSIAQRKIHELSNAADPKNDPPELADYFEIIRSSTPGAPEECLKHIRAALINEVGTEGDFFFEETMIAFNKKYPKAKTPQNVVDVCKHLWKRVETHRLKTATADSGKESL